MISGQDWNMSYKVFLGWNGIERDHLQSDRICTARVVRTECLHWMSMCTPNVIPFFCVRMTNVFAEIPESMALVAQLHNAHLQNSAVCSGEGGGSRCDGRGSWHR